MTDLLLYLFLTNAVVNIILGVTTLIMGRAISTLGITQLSLNGRINELDQKIKDEVSIRKQKEQDRYIR